MSRDIKMGMLIMLVGIGIFLLFVLVQPRNTPYQDPNKHQEPISAAAVETVLAATSKAAAPARIDLEAPDLDADEAGEDGESREAAPPTGVPAAGGNTPTIPASPAPRATQAAGSRSYEVKKGDTYWSIAEAAYGDGKKYLLLEKANPEIEPTKLREGMTIVIPAADARDEQAKVPARVVAATETATPRQDGTTYVVEKTDTLYSIARKFYNKPSLYKMIYEANKDKIKDPNNVPAGIEIVIPQYN